MDSDDSNKIIDLIDVRNQIDPDDRESIRFLGHDMTKGEYELSCKNLRDLFKLLKAWRKESANEPSEL